VRDCRKDRTARVLLLSILGAVAACQSPGGARQDAQAADEWTRQLPLTADGELEIINTSGAIEVEGTSGAVVDVRADRVARATTEQGARDLLTHIAIGAESVPGRVTIQTERISGVLIGVSFVVNYHVKAPASATIRTRTANGSTTITGASGRVIVNDVNGAVVGRAISGGIEVRAVNTNIDVDLVEVGHDPIDLRAVNGQVQLTLPEGADANLSATSTSGLIDVTGLRFEKFGDENRRRVRGRLNAGGTPIELNAVNGNIHVTAR
jgi:DUF4097 and DUF4098 domain-containing protein YvlB